MRFVVESWSPEYGAPVELEAIDDANAPVANVEVEVPREKWGPIRPQQAPAANVAFVDGVQQMDARIWMSDDDGLSRMGYCVSFGAGCVRCDGEARLEMSEVKRSVFASPGFATIDCREGVRYVAEACNDTSPQVLDKHVQQARDILEVAVAQRVLDADFIVIDGHLSRREGIAGAVGYIKSHHAQYLPPDLAGVVGRLAGGERTPVFLLEGGSGYSRYSWYLKLPGGEGHSWAGVVRCEISTSSDGENGDFPFVDRVSATLPRFASQPYKDARAPQNLYPIAALERELRRRLGDRTLLLRSLQRASHGS